MTVSRRKDSDASSSVIMHKVADIRGGVSVKTSNLGGNVLYEGTPVTAPKDGIVEVVKYAQLAKATANGDKTVVVTKRHNFAVGDKLAFGESTKATITKIDTSATSTDTITISVIVGGVFAKGAFIPEADSTKEPFAIVGETKEFSQDSNLAEDAWVIAVTKGLNPEVAEKLKGVVNYD